MHELSICKSLLRQLDNVVTAQHGVKVEKIFLQVGPLSGVEPGLLQHAFPIASINTFAEHAELVIHVPAVRTRCRECGSEAETSLNKPACGACGSRQTELLRGDELLLERVEVRNEH